MHGKDDVEAYSRAMADYPGVVIARDADTYRLFDGGDREIGDIDIAALDVNGHSHLDQLFYHCSIVRLGKLEGAERVKSASDMFYQTNVPDGLMIDFPAWQGPPTALTNSLPPG